MKKCALFFLLLPFFLVSCGGSVDTSQPPEIVYGEDICAECGMIISEPRFAAAFYTADGNAKAFDDIGGMCIHLAKHEEQVVSYWVHDYDTEKWIAAEEASYVMSADIYTPMAFGVVAFTDNARADAFAGEFAGMRMTFLELLDRYEAGSESAHPEHND